MKSSPPAYLECYYEFFFLYTNICDKRQFERFDVHFHCTSWFNIYSLEIFVTEIRSKWGVAGTRVDWALLKNPKL